MATKPTPVVTVKNRRGRKRKLGDRHPCGRLINNDNARSVVFDQPHRRMLGEVRDKVGRVILPDRRLDQRAENPLGWLRLNGKITEEEYAFGLMFTRVVRNYLAVLDAPNPTMRPAPRSGITIPEHEAKRRKQVYEEMFEGLHRAGQRAQRCLSRVCVYERPLEPPDYSLEDLRKGLSTGVELYGLTAGRKSGSFRNRL